MAPEHAVNRPTRLDVVLRVLDHQVVGPEKELVGNIDDLELTPAGEPLAVTGFAVGPGGLSQRLPGRLGSWVGAVWRRLSADSDPQPVVVPVGHITAIGSAITVDDRSTRALAESFGLEHWLRRFVISRIPGAKGGSEPERQEGGGPMRPSNVLEPPTRPPQPGCRWVSTLLRAPVVDDTGHRLGNLIELRCTSASEPWRVTHIQCTQSVLGTELGYHADPDLGPALLQRFFRRIQRHDLLIPVTEVTEIRPDPTRIIVATRDDRRHPHHTRDG
jgi:sporulation protein YlmC with PRC-barrel domain